MALQRIRDNNQEFANAELTRAHIRVRNQAANAGGGIRRLFPDHASLYNNSPAGMYQDIIDEILAPTAGRGMSLPIGTLFNPGVGGRAPTMDDILQAIMENDPK